MSLLRPLPFGGCNLHIPIARAAQEGRIDRRYRDAVPRQAWPLALSATAMVQMHQFLVGEEILPPGLCQLYLGEEEFSPAPNAAQIVAETDVALIEISSPFEFAYEGLILNANRLSEFFDEYCSTTGTPLRNFELWRGALLKLQPDKARELGENFSQSLVQPTWHGIELAGLIAKLRCDKLSLDETVRRLGELKERLDKPVGMIIHNFRFMPDGRAISWPVEFKRESVAAAERLGLPMLDLAPFVIEHGPALVVAEDGRHWEPDTGLSLVGGALAQFTQTLAAASKTAVATRPLPPTPAAALIQATAVPIVPEYAFDPRSGSHFPLHDDLMPMVLVLGDAWALGENQDPEDPPVTPLPEHPEHALMFAAGAAPRDKLMGRFKPLSEKQSSWRRETPCSGLADVVMTECAIRFGSKPRMLFAAAGHPQAKLVAREAGAQGFGRGSDVHQSVMNMVSAAKHLAAAEGRKLQLLAFCFAQCRNDENLDGVSRPYWDALLKLRRHYDADCRTITGQSEPIPLLAAQNNRGAARLGKFPAVAAAQLAATDVDPLVRCIGPAYQFDAEHNIKDGQAWRLSSNSYRRLGRLFGRYLMDDVLGPGDRPLRAIAARWSGERRIMLDYGRPLAIDTSGAISLAELGDGLGIDFVDGPRPSARIVSVGINPIRPARLEIELDREPSGTAPRLYIAARSTGNAKVGRMDGPRSAIRMANPRDHDPRTGEPIYDWACSEVIDVA